SSWPLFPGIFVTLDNKNKRNGFRNTKWRRPVMDTFLYYIPRFPLDQYKPVKARDTTVYLVQRMNAGSAPNLFITTDFISFKPITNFQPQHPYNWLTVELTKEGLLYKPENFDSTKHYPVIFHYYEKSSDGLYRYLLPQPGAGSLNIPWYVSNGYIVFIPDIITEKGYPGPSAAKAVIKAAKYLSGFPWVDTAHMGLQGHSFGGYVTNYLVTSTNLFKAAQSSAGPSDFFSGYGSIRKQTGTGMQALYERGQNNMGVPPWENPELYVENSPVLHAHKINTPLLLMHNENDNAVPVAQSIEFFTALRRLQKPVWLIQYKDEGHLLFSDANKLDFDIRQQAFFDHYLKNKPLPEWMKAH
ncbi:MAG TPA: prolyl oligopeptidase family serine peptidase, partial [Chitinophaga sp.]|nr:prolyl oligopeptidase family serine peptidase [Chitinophaga sp.]